MNKTYFTITLKSVLSMRGKRSTSTNALLDVILKDTEFVKVELNNDYLQSFLRPFLKALENDYPADWQTQQKVWRQYAGWLTRIRSWIEQNAGQVLSWRNNELRWRESFKLLADLYALKGVEVTTISPEQDFYPFLIERRDNLQRWTDQLWELESLIIYALNQSLPAQFYGAGLEQSDIAAAFAEKLDDILLTYDPTLAGHASLKTYATYLVYRHLLDKLRRSGYNGSSTSSKVKDVELEQVPAPLDLTTIAAAQEIKEKGLEVCIVTLVEASAVDTKGPLLSKIRLKLFYFNLLELVVNHNNPQGILLSEVADIFLNLADSKLAPPAKELLQLASHKKLTTLQNLNDALSLDYNTLANRVQLSQARRIVAARTNLTRTVKEFVETAPYKPSVREPLTQKPLKIVDFCFTNFGLFGYNKVNG